MGGTVSEGLLGCWTTPHTALWVRTVISIIRRLWPPLPTQGTRGQCSQPWPLEGSPALSFTLPSPHQPLVFAPHIFFKKR